MNVCRTLSCIHTRFPINLFTIVYVTWEQILSPIVLSICHSTYPRALNIVGTQYLLIDFNYLYELSSSSHFKWQTVFWQETKLQCNYIKLHSNIWIISPLSQRNPDVLLHQLNHPFIKVPLISWRYHCAH